MLNFVSLLARISMSYGQMSKTAGSNENSAVGVILILDIFVVRPFPLKFAMEKIDLSWFQMDAFASRTAIMSFKLFLLFDKLIGCSEYCMPVVHRIQYAWLLYAV